MDKINLQYTLRPAEDADGPFLFALFCETKAGEFSALGLPDAALEPLLAMQFRARNAGYASVFPDARSTVISVDGLPAGQLLVDDGVSTIHLVDISLMRAIQGKGIGSQVLAGLIAQAKSEAKLLRLSVRFDNPAMRLYESVGFVRTGGDGLNVVMEMGANGLESAPDRVGISEDADEPAEPMSSRWFRRLVGQRFTARSENGLEVELTLKSVSTMPVYGKDRSIEAGDSFSLNFSGPLTPVIPSAITIVTTLAGEQANIFLSPSGPGTGGMEYESVFNRTRRVMSSRS